MQRRAVLIWVLAVLAQQGAPTRLLADQGRGRGRGGDDGKGDDDREDDGQDDDRVDDDGGDDSDGRTGKDSGDAGGGGPSEVDADILVIRYADGSAERFRNGRYQRIDAAGAIVEDRPGLGTDRARLAAARPGRGREMVIRIDSRTNEVETSDRGGWREQIVRGTYLLTDPNGNVVRRRGVRASDIARIHQLAGG